jgi:hypothetical protein
MLIAWRGMGFVMTRLSPKHHTLGRSRLTRTAKIRSSVSVRLAISAPQVIAKRQAKINAVHGISDFSLIYFV